MTPLPCSPYLPLSFPPRICGLEAPTQPTPPLPPLHTPRRSQRSMACARAQVSTVADSGEAQTKQVRTWTERGAQPRHAQDGEAVRKVYAKKVYLTQDSLEAGEPELEPEPLGKDPEREHHSVDLASSSVETTEVKQ